MFYPLDNWVVKRLTILRNLLLLIKVKCAYITMNPGYCSTMEKFFMFFEQNNFYWSLESFWGRTAISRTRKKLLHWEILCFLTFPTFFARIYIRITLRHATNLWRKWKQRRKKTRTEFSMIKIKSELNINDYSEAKSKQKPSRSCGHELEF